MYRWDHKAYLSKPELTSEEALTCRRVSPAVPVVTSGLKTWLRIVGHIYLNTTEQKIWYSFPPNGPRRLEWLLGRIAAKDAVRAWAFERHHIKVRPAHIEIVQDKWGKPSVVSSALKSLKSCPQISISHCGDCALAAVVDGTASVGIDFESLKKREAGDWLARAFTDTELALTADRSPNKLLALWAAKEAASKAAGTGLRGRWREWKIVKISKNNTNVTVRFERREYPVRLIRRDDEIIAVCKIGVTNADGVSGWLPSAHPEMG